MEVPYASYSTGICCLTLGFDAVDSMVLWLMVARFFNHHQNHDDIPHHELDLSLHGIPQVMTGVEKLYVFGRVTGGATAATDVNGNVHT